MPQGCWAASQRSGPLLGLAEKTMAFSALRCTARIFANPHFSDNTEQSFLLGETVDIYGCLGSFLTCPLNLSTVFPLNFLIFSHVLSSAGFDCFHISLSQVLDIPISFLFWVVQGSCSVGDFIFPLCKFLSSAFESTLSGGYTLENSSDFNRISSSFATVCCRLGP